MWPGDNLPGMMTLLLPGERLLLGWLERCRPPIDMAILVPQPLLARWLKPV